MNYTTLKNNIMIFSLYELLLMFLKKNYNHLFDNIYSYIRIMEIPNNEYLFKKILIMKNI